MALAGLVGRYSGPHTVVCGLSKGGTLLAAEVARWVGAAVDFLLVRTLDLPCDQKTVVGAVGPGGLCVLDELLTDLLDVETDAIATLRSGAKAGLEELNHALRGGRAPPNLNDHTVVLVDDVIAGTLEVRAAVLYLRQQDARGVMVAAPVVTRSVLPELRLLVNEAVAVETPECAPEIGRIYVNAAPPSDAEVRRVLGVSAASVPGIVRSSTDDA